mmetsp:Transcript_53137/g.108370  ORF Transcript_53137/g.108370 Transcript_53137/m.108370 type:complete len:226 (-) Transcript_53137:624-1301(-)
MLHCSAIALVPRRRQRLLLPLLCCCFLRRCLGLVVVQVHVEVEPHHPAVRACALELREVGLVPARDVLALGRVHVEVCLHVDAAVVLEVVLLHLLRVRLVLGDARTCLCNQLLQPLSLLLLLLRTLSRCCCCCLQLLACHRPYPALLDDELALGIRLLRRRRRRRLHRLQLRLPRLLLLLRCLVLIALHLPLLLQHLPCARDPSPHVALLWRVGGRIILLVPPLL